MHYIFKSTTKKVEIENANSNAKDFHNDITKQCLMQDVR